jgi:uncharacterized protein (TIGR03067 family)
VLPDKLKRTSYSQAALVVLASLCMVPAFGQNGAGTAVPVVEELIGTWELISIIENGVDVTGNSGPGGDRILVYRFDRDGTFSITAGGDWFESGTWAARADTVPKQFDHTPTEAPGDPDIVDIESLGIYEYGDGIAKLCVADAPPDVRPTEMDTDTCILFIVRRVLSE